MLVVLGVCGGCAQARSEPSESGGVGPPDASMDDAGSSDGGRDGGNLSCELPELSREPGRALTALDALGTGPCASTTLGAAIDAVHAAQPELDDIRDLYIPDANRGGDQSYI